MMKSGLCGNKPQMRKLDPLVDRIDAEYPSAVRPDLQPIGKRRAAVFCMTFYADRAFRNLRERRLQTGKSIFYHGNLPRGYRPDGQAICTRSSII